MNDFVEVDSANSFDLYSIEKTWYKPRLSHSRLTNIVSSAEASGLGTADEILLCMIPALSFTDLLPNESMLGLMPSKMDQFQTHGWENVAGFYLDLLSTRIRGALQESFALAVVVDTMEFVQLAFEPYNHEVIPEYGLASRLGRILEFLSGKVSDTLKKLSPYYDLQGRRQTFQDIFSQCGDETVRQFALPKWAIGGTEEPSDFQNKIGFTRAHLFACSTLNGNITGKCLPCEQVLHMEVSL
jgi:hypothetical protein